VTVDAVAQRIVRLARKAGVKLTTKVLRRGFGCRYAGKVSAHVLQRLMRHSDLRITMDYYANIDQAVEEAVLGPQRNTPRNTPPAPPIRPRRALTQTLTAFGKNDENRIFSWFLAHFFRTLLLERLGLPPGRVGLAEPVRQVGVLHVDERV
jgi:hypothetical protein